MDDDHNRSDLSNRRRFIKNLGVAAGGAALSTALPGKWSKPVIKAGALPAHAAVSPVATSPIYFRIALNGFIQGSISQTSWTGSITLTFNFLITQFTTWEVSFVGNTSGLSDPVPVTVSSAVGGLLVHLWTINPNETVNLNFPRSGGGTVGLGGTVLNTAAFRPWAAAVADGITGTLTLSSPGVQTMTVTMLSVV